jgi:threonine dehydratase
VQPTIDRAAIADTAERIRPYVRRTPVVEIAGEDFGVPALADVRLALKLELTQHAGSFKARGAFTHLLTGEVPAAGVVAASGGNHGAAVAYAARVRGVAAKIFIPSISSPAKIERIRSYGADLVVGGDRYADALAAAEAWERESGARQIHAFDQPQNLLGTGTCGMEIEEQTPGLDAVLAAVGGGGLIGGIAAWFAGSATKVIAVEPEEAPTLARALEAGEPVDAPTGGLAADSLAPRRIGRLVFPIAQRHVARAVLVTDDAIRAAQQALWRVLRVVVEPGGACAFAALLSGRYVPAPGARIGVVLSGGNTTAVDFERSWPKPTPP